MRSILNACVVSNNACVSFPNACVKTCEMDAHRTRTYGGYGTVYTGPYPYRRRFGMTFLRPYLYGYCTGRPKLGVNLFFWPYGRYPPKCHPYTVYGQNPYRTVEALLPYGLRPTTYRAFSKPVMPSWEVNGGNGLIPNAPKRTKRILP
ncbi:hypothetical protein ARMGADRAFT_1028265 [Armillaria gallica]|uniref:Uncharacterized protein n=1 Tax=Armillaria gallica TaxID=47427 RepID=A0A2H3DQ91_ARMGA|nr:hypothetical protein ARMGADRAFT_1028265 [Armillaria gallica]